MNLGAELVHVVRMFEYVREHPPGSNSGEFVDYCLRYCGLDPEQLSAENKPWCAAGLSTVAHRWFGNIWPFPVSASVVTIYEACRTRFPKVKVADALPGDVGFVWSKARKRMAHILVITGPKGLTGSFNTSKPGDTNPETQREGWGYFEKEWPFTAKDELYRWWGR